MLSSSLSVFGLGPIKLLTADVLFTNTEMSLFVVLAYKVPLSIAGANEELTR